MQAEQTQNQKGRGGTILKEVPFPAHRRINHNWQIQRAIPAAAAEGKKQAQLWGKPGQGFHFTKGPPS